jgi:hypothetical protein
MLPHCIHGDGWITGTPADATKGLSLIGVAVAVAVAIAVGVGFGSDEFAIGSATPEVGAAGLEEGTSKGAKGSDELTGITALKSGSGKLQKKFLERLVRLRRADRTRISGVGSQWPPSAWLNG